MWFARLRAILRVVDAGGHEVFTLATGGAWKLMRTNARCIEIIVACGGAAVFRAQGAIMIRVKGYYRNHRLELEQPLDLAEGREVEIIVRPVEPLTAEEEDEEWREFGAARLEEEWDNDQDAIYDNWRELYGD
jgi:hypothetical protein